LLFPNWISLLDIRVKWPMLPILGGDLPSAGDVGCMKIFCKKKHHHQQNILKLSHSFMLIKFYFLGVRGRDLDLVCTSFQRKILFCLNNFPNKITITKNMFPKRRTLALQAWYYNGFHMVMQKVIVWIPTTFKKCIRAWDHQMNSEQNNRIVERTRRTSL